MVGKPAGIVIEIMAGVMMAAADGVSRKSVRMKGVRGKSASTQGMPETRCVTEMGRTPGGEAMDAAKAMETPSTWMEAAKCRMKTAAADVKTAPAATAHVKAAPAAAVKTAGAFGDRRNIHRDAKRAHRNACRENCYRSFHGVS